MLKCRACLSRCRQSLDACATYPHRLRRNVNATFITSQIRLYETSTHPSTGSSTEPVVRKTNTDATIPSEVHKLHNKKENPWKESAVAANQKKAEKAALTSPPLSERDYNNRKRELQYLQDPLELADFVNKQLGRGKVTEMLQLVRMASRSMQCIVSWNHIIDHYLAKERISDALKVYNEMKKRAQFPDSYTYTILLRGLSINAHHSGVLSKALSIYHSLYAPNSRVEPSIIHTNAALRVCARCMDMDALWGIAGKIPETGPASANKITYITLINALRQNLLVSGPNGETADEAATRKERGIIEGRRLWEIIVNKWRVANLSIDEELVCAMGRLLLIGSRPRDWDDVLSLVEQTMDIPRLVPRLGTPARQEAGFPKLRAPNVPEHMRSQENPLASNADLRPGDEFLALTPQGVGSLLSNPLAYVRPGNNTLSLIQEACNKIVATKAADEYWELLTDPTTYNIVPDLNNLHIRLRTMRQNRSSSAAVKILQDEIIGKNITPRPGTLRIAMSTCVRDKNNHNSLNNATKILQMMYKSVEDADPKTTEMYATLAGKFPLAKGSDLINAVVALDPAVKSIRLQLGVGGKRYSGEGVGASYLVGEARKDAIGALGSVQSLCDKVIYSDLIPEEQKKPFKRKQAILSAFVQRIHHKARNPEKRASKQQEVEEEPKKSEEEDIDQRN